MNSRHRGLTTGAAAAALAITISLGAQSEVQNAVPNAQNHRFIPAKQPVDAETATPAAASQGATAQSVQPEPISSGTFREAPTGFDNRTNGFDPQGPNFDNLTADNVVALRSFNDNRFV